MGAYLLWAPEGTNTLTDTLSSFLSFDVVTTENPAFPAQVAEHVVEHGADVSDNVRVGCLTLTLEVFVTNEPIDSLPQWGSGSVGNSGPITTPDTQQPPLTPPGPSLSVPIWFSLPVGIPLVGPLTSALGLNDQTTTIQATAGMPPTHGVTMNPRVLQFGSSFDAVQLTHDQLDTLRQSAQLIEVVGSKGTYDNMVIEHFEMLRNAETGSGAIFTIQFKEIRIVQSQTVNAPQPTKPRAKPKQSKGSQSTTNAEGATASSFLSTIVALFSGQTVPPLHSTP